MNLYKYTCGMKPVSFGSNSDNILMYFSISTVNEQSIRKLDK